MITIIAVAFCTQIYVCGNAMHTTKHYYDRYQFLSYWTCIRRIFFLYCFFLYPFSISFFPVSDDELKIRIWYLISLQSCIAERFFFYYCCCLRLEYHINRGNTMSGKHTENNEKLLTQTNKHSMRLIQRELWFRPLLLYIHSQIKMEWYRWWHIYSMRYMQNDMQS